MESGLAPTPKTTEPGRTTVQLLVASSAVLALLQLVASTSVDVYNGQRAGWWVAIQGTTVAFAAAFAGAAAGSNGAWWRRMQQKSGSTTPSSLATGVASASVAGAVFAVLCWAASSLGNASSPMAVAVLVAALLGGVAGSARIGGAILAGLVATFVATLFNLTGQALSTMFLLAPAVSHGRGGLGGSLTFDAFVWGISTVSGAATGVWWLSRRRQRTGISHAIIVGIFPGLLLAAGSVGGLIAWALVKDPDKDEALRGAIGAHGLQLGISLVCGVLAAVIAVRTVHRWHTVAARFTSLLRRSRSGGPAGTARMPRREPDSHTPAEPAEPPGTVQDGPGRPVKTAAGTAGSAAPEVTLEPPVRSRRSPEFVEPARSTPPDDPTPLTVSGPSTARAGGEAASAGNSRTSGRLAGGGRGKASADAPPSGRHRANGRTLPTMAGEPASPSSGNHGTRGRLTRLIPTQPLNGRRAARAAKSRKG